MPSIFTAPDGLTDVCVQAPRRVAAGQWVVSGFVQEEWIGATLDVFIVILRPDQEAIDALGGFDGGESYVWTDLSAEINGVAANACGYLAIIGTWTGTRYNPFAEFGIYRAADDFCGDAAPFAYYQLESFNRNCGPGGSTTSFNRNPRIKLTRTSTAEVLLDIEFTPSGANGIPSPGDWCQTPSSHTGGPWAMVVHAGNVVLADGVTWVSLA